MVNSQAAHLVDEGDVDGGQLCTGRGAAGAVNLVWTLTLASADAV
jgi:hypothetical protein